MDDLKVELENNEYDPVADIETENHYMVLYQILSQIASVFFPNFNAFICA